METWFNAADYIISGSHHEGGSYVLMEALACGCVPVVTDIPASLHAIDNGRVGAVFEKGNSESLYRLLTTLQPPTDQQRAGCAAHFLKEISPQAIAEKLLLIYDQLKTQ